MAKNFMMHYPLVIVVDIVEAVVSPSRRPTITRVSTCINVYLCVYYSKVRFGPNRVNGAASGASSSWTMAHAGARRQHCLVVFNVPRLRPLR